MNYTFVLICLCSVQVSYAQEIQEGKSNSVAFGQISRFQSPNFEGTSNIVHFYTRNSADVLIGVSAPLTFRDENQNINVQVSETKQDNSRHREVAPIVRESSDGELNSAPSYHALIIGIDDYRHNASNLSDLNKPVKDATMLYTILVSQYNFNTTKTKLLKNPTRDQIIASLEELAKGLTTKDNLLIFFAGHGVWDERLKTGYWLPADAKIDNKSNWIANSTLRDYIAGIETKHTLLISDACFSGSIFRTRDASTAINEYGVAKIYQLPSRKGMTSGMLTTVPDDSKFMEYLIKRLNDNKEKYFTARQLFYSLETAVLNNTNTVPQFGVIQETGDEGGDFIFIKK